MAKGKSKDGAKNRETKLVEMPNGGRLWSHGPPPDRQVPGPGRPRSAIKAAALQAYGDRLHILTAIADDKKHRERIAALKLLADTGDANRPMAIDPELIRELSDAVDAVLSGLPGGDEAKQAIYERWAMTLGRRMANE